MPMSDYHKLLAAIRDPLTVAYATATLRRPI